LITAWAPALTFGRLRLAGALLDLDRFVEFPFSRLPCPALPEKLTKGLAAIN
jgi:hypothetical protein